MLNLQVKTADGPAIQQSERYRRGSADLIDYEFEKWVSKQITEAEMKYGRLQNELILLVAAKNQPFISHVNWKWIKVSHNQSQFRGIYLTAPKQRTGEKILPEICFEIKQVPELASLNRYK